MSTTTFRVIKRPIYVTMRFSVGYYGTRTNVRIDDDDDGKGEDVKTCVQCFCSFETDNERCNRKKISSLSTTVNTILSFSLSPFLLLNVIEYTYSMSGRRSNERTNEREKKKNSRMIYNIPLTAAICHPSSSSSVGALEKETIDVFSRRVNDRLRSSQISLLIFFELEISSSPHHTSML